LTKKAKLRVEEKKIKKETAAENTVLTPTPLQTPPHKPKRSGVCVSTTVLCHQKKASVLRLKERK
jgi:hypothetical protein